MGQNPYKTHSIRCLAKVCRLSGGAFPTIIAIISMFFIGTAGIGGSVLSTLLLMGVIVLGIGMTFLVSRLLSPAVPPAANREGDCPLDFRPDLVCLRQGGGSSSPRRVADLVTGKHSIWQCKFVGVLCRLPRSLCTASGTGWGDPVRIYSWVPS